MSGSLINFTGSGIAQVSCPQTGKSVTSGTIVVIDPESALPVASTSITGSVTSFTITGAHTSRDSYLVVPMTQGYSSEGRLYSGLSPTVEVMVEDFQSYVVSGSGSVLINTDFEYGTTSGLELTITGGGGVSQSGLYNSTNMQGNYYVGLSSSSDNSIIIEPTDTAASGINCGRTTFLARLGTSLVVATDSAVGFAFMRQDSTLTSNCYKILFNRDGEYAYDYSIQLITGQMTNGNGVITGSSTLVTTRNITFGNKYSRDLNRLIWICIEWEVLDKGVLIRIYYKLYNSSDTINSIKSDLSLILEVIHSGTTNGGEYYTTSPGKVAWLLGSDSTSTGEVGIDCISLETLPSLPRDGINSLTLLERNEATTSSACRPLIRNFLVGNYAVPPIGSLKMGIPINNPLISPERSIYGKAGCGFLGIAIDKIGGDASDQCYGLFIFKEDSAKGIKHGVCRICGYINYIASTDTRLGLAILRQSSVHNCNSYVVELCYTGAITPVLRIRKGWAFSEVLDDSANFAGSVVATSSTLNYSAGNPIWIETRWKAEALQTKIEVLYYAGQAGRFSFDSSPGNVDYKLTSVLTYTDTGSPYISTEEPPMLLLLTEGTTRIDLYQCELRRCKYGN